MMKKLALFLCLTSPLIAQINGVPNQTVNSYGGVNTFGDSITNGAGATTFMDGGAGATAYAWQLLNAYGGNGVNYGYGGDMAGDLVLKLTSNLAPTPANNFLTTIMDSTNEVSIYGTDSTLQTVFTEALSNAIAWAAIPNTGKLLMSTDGSTLNGACSATGWAVFNNLGTGYQPFLYSHTQSDVATCTLTTYQSGPIYVSYLIENQSVWNSASNFSVTVDGGAATNFAPAPTASTITTANGTAAIPILGRIAGPFAAGTHTIVITNTAATGGVPATAAVVFWLGAPVPAGTNQAPPNVFVGGTPWNNGNSPASTTAAYNTLIQNTVTTLSGDGLNVHFINIRNYLNSSTDYAGGTLSNGIVCPASAFLPLHPNDCGHAHLAQAFLASMPTPNFSGPLPLLTYYGPTRSLSGGNGWVFGSSPAWQVGTTVGLNATATACGTLSAVGGIVTACTASSGSAMTLISDQKLSSPAATVTFSSIPGTYKYLRVYYNARCSASALSDALYMQANGDTSADYLSNLNIASGNSAPTGAGSLNATSAMETISCATAVAGGAGSGVIDFIDYASTTFLKHATANGTAETAASIAVGNTNNIFTGWEWNNTAAITSLTFGMAGGSNFVTGSRFTLYGIN